MRNYELFKRMLALIKVINKGKKEARKTECQTFAMKLREWKLIKSYLIKWCVVLWNVCNEEIEKGFIYDS